MISHTVAHSVVLSFLLLFTATGLSPATAQDEVAPLPTETLVVRSGDKEHTFTVEVASTDRQRARGLMFREEMATDHGMLFVFEGEGDRFFWMKNTPLPLDIIYIDAKGWIVSIAADTTPFSEAVIPSREPAKYVLELNAGISAELGLEPGDGVSSPSMMAE
ncbi:DUF192 domain-containing protein [Roseibium porphyridii]|uniref:DUF192 domain-containing protein n=1 Tax=Roseibium porphyridii TaxID=2866279 RepID=A0ABY8F186_9HYPH|nr:DUF192 domain-containing protein [Roseibium sp. KMA01]WFE87767.1 DUF192 domain-containing protein [Roseibium sp. KMA01]